MRLFSSVIGCALLFCTFHTATAQEAPVALPEQPVPVISGPTDVAVGRTLVLEASASRGISEATEFRWYRDDIPQPISRSVEAVFTPEEVGTAVLRLVMTNAVGDETLSGEAEYTITVYQKKIVLIADNTVPVEKIVSHQRRAREEGVFLSVLKPKQGKIPIADENALFTLVSEQSDVLTGAETVIVWSDGISGLQALTRIAEGDDERRAALANQTIVAITDGGLKTLARSARGPFSVLKPDRIILTRKEAINPLITSETADEFLNVIDQWDLDYLIVDESTAAVRPWNLVSSLVNYMLTHGVPSRTVILLLMLPVIATIIAFLKQVIGITTFGLYMPSVLSLSFIALGWTVAVPFLIFIIFTGYLSRAMMRRYRMLYFPKVAIILTVVSFTLLILLGIGAFFDLVLTGDTIFILLIMSTLSESFLNVKTEEGLYSAIIGIGETILAALLCAFLVQWSVLQSFILAYPELILLTLLMNVLLGKWTGLRLVEYFRFKEVLKNLQEE